MRFTNLLTRTTTRSATPGRRVTTAEAPRCPTCAADHRHCHGTLVLHADGNAHCDEAAECEGREDLHDWWLPCTDLGCGCTGDEQPQHLLLAA